MLAIAYLVYATKKLGVSLDAITYSHTCPHGIATIKALLRSLNAVIPPIGKMACEWVEKENYSKKVAVKFANKSDYVEVKSAVSVLRETLLKNEKTTVCAIGPLTNIADLLQSECDEFSPLNGVELFKEKCDRLIVMGGRFTDEENGTRLPEWNFQIDIEATKMVVKTCPVPVVFLPFEVGVKVLSGGAIMNEYGEDTPLSLSFLKFSDTKERGGRFSWDPITAVYTVEGCKDWLEESVNGEVCVTGDGVSRFVEKEDGLHKILRFNKNRVQAEVVEEFGRYIDACALEICEYK
jgi:inosine-uridine nucleoside N-ribohydrolase